MTGFALLTHRGKLGAAGTGCRVPYEAKAPGLKPGRYKVKSKTTQRRGKRTGLKTRRYKVKSTVKAS